MNDVILALAPAMLMAVVFFGSKALIVMALATASACLTEWVILRRPLTLAGLWGDGSSALAGLLLGMTLSPLVPWWMPVLGGILAVAVGKQLFGGLGRNIFNPALVARAILLLTWPAQNVRWAAPFDGVSGATPLVSGASRLWELLAGHIPGSVGETSVLAILLGGAYLFHRGHIDWRIPSGVIAGAMLTSALMGSDPLYAVLAGGLMFTAFFMATDMVTSPVTRSGRFLFGLVVGILTIIIRYYSMLPEGVTFSVLIGNALVPMFDRYTQSFRFGEGTPAGRRMREAISFAMIVVLTGAAALGVVSVTQEMAVIHAYRTMVSNLGEVLPAADAFEEKEINGRTVFIGTAQGQEVGVGFYWEERGFNGPITLLVGVDEQGSVVDVKVVQHEEDPGLGGKVADPSFLSQFQGKTYQDELALHHDVEAISGATISSQAVTTALRNALTFHASVFLDVDEEDTLDLAHIPDGTYTGEGEGFMGPVTVEVTVEDGQITHITVMDHSDTPTLAQPAFSAVIDQIVGEQTLDVDGVSGATASSYAIEAAVRNALEAFGAPDAQPPHAEGDPIDWGSLSAGEYRGKADGFYGDIHVLAVVEAGRLVELEVTRHEDTAGVAEPAFRELIEVILAQQRIDVDAISGATASSQGLLDATREALTGPVETRHEAWDLSGVPDGEYRGTGQGFNGDVEVAISIKDGELVAVIVVAHQDTAHIADDAFSTLIQASLEAQGAGVDAVSGATKSSQGFIEALRRALEEAVATES